MPGQRLPHAARRAGVRAAPRHPRRLRVPDPRAEAVGGRGAGARPRRGSRRSGPGGAAGARAVDVPAHRHPALRAQPGSHLAPRHARDQPGVDARAAALPGERDAGRRAVRRAAAVRLARRPVAAGFRIGWLARLSRVFTVCARPLVRGRDSCRPLPVRPLAGAGGRAGRPRRAAGPVRCHATGAPSHCRVRAAPGGGSADRPPRRPFAADARAAHSGPGVRPRHPVLHRGRARAVARRVVARRLVREGLLRIVP